MREDWRRAFSWRRVFQVTLLCWLGAGLLLQSAGVSRADTRIPLRADMIVNETAIGDATLLVDEQATIGNPGSGKGLTPRSAFFPGWTSWQYPVDVLIDLGAPYFVTRAMIYNDTGEHPLTLSTGHPFAWRDQAITLGGFHVWRSFRVDVISRYLRIALSEPTSIPELAIYGEQRGDLPSRARSHPRRISTQQPMDQFVGTNAFIDDPPEKLAAAVGFVREYHDWLWDTEAPDHKLRLQPSGAAGGNAWFFDDFYASLRRSGVTVCPAIQQSSPVYFPGTDLDAKPVPRGADPEAPASYANHAAHLFQYAARYGGTRVPDAELKVAPGQPRVSGLGLLRYLENWNEPDKTWRGRAARFSPYELAAMCSADYDGDQGRMGHACGVKQADPGMRLSIGGLAGIGIDYLQAMKVWSDWHRRGDFPADAINVHHYSSDGTAEQPFKTTGISPEADHLREKLTEIVAWRDANVPKCEIWLTEYGYDTNAKSPLHAPAIGSWSGEEVQAIWLVRSTLALAAAGVDRAAMFLFRDDKSDGSGVFETCGMVTEKGQWRPKPSYYYLSTLKRRLTGMRYTGDISSGRKDVVIYRFAAPNGRSAFVIWRPTSDGGRGVIVTVPTGWRGATRIDFENGSLDGVSSPANLKRGAVTLEASEKPVILLSP